MDDNADHEMIDNMSEVMFITEYLDRMGINWMPINLKLEYNEAKGKNIKTLLPYKETGCYPSFKDFQDNITMVYERQLYDYKYIWIDTYDTFQIDIDDKDADFPIDKYKLKYPYFKSVGKSLPHFLVYCPKNFDTDAYDTISNIPTKIVNEEKHYDFLGGQASYALRNTKVINANKPLEITEDELISYFPTLVETKHDINDKTSNLSKPCDWSNDGKVSLLDIINIQYIDLREHWIKLIWAMRHSNYSQDEARDFSMKSSKYSDSGFLNVWNSYMSDPHSDECKFGTICHYAKISNPTIFKSLQLEEFNKKKRRENIRNCTGTHHELANILYEFHKHEFVCAEPSGRLWYMFNGSTWKIDKGNINFENKICDLSYVFDREASQVMLELGIDDLASQTTKSESGARTHIRLLKKIARDLQSDSYIKSVLNRARTSGFYDHKFINRLDTNINLLGFDNGVYDFTINSFRQGHPEDYVSMSVGYDYISETHTEYACFIKKYFETIYTDINLRKYNLMTFARQLMGDKGCELVHLHTASGSNGKSKLFEVLGELFGQYMSVFDVSLLVTTQRSKQSGSPDPEKTTWKGVRILYCNEPEENEIIHSGTLKGMTDKIKVRTLFNDNYIEFIPQFKLHILCNNLPQINGSDTGVQRRIRTVPYHSKFVDTKEQVDILNNKFLKNDNCSLFINDSLFKNEGIKYILSHYQSGWLFEAPQEVLESSKQYIKDCDIFAEFVTDFLETNEQGIVTLKEIKEVIKTSEYHNKIKTGHSLKTNIENALDSKCIPKKKIYNKTITNAFIGWNIIQKNNLIE